MEPRPELARHLAPDARIVAVGLDAASARELAATGTATTYDSAAAFLESNEAGIDLLLLAPGALSPPLLEAATERRSERGAVAVSIEVPHGVRMLDAAPVRDTIVALSSAGYSIQSPVRWLERAEPRPLLVVARYDGHVIRSYETGDERAILDLFEASFGQRRPLDWWRWEYADNPHGRLAISLAFDAEGLVAQYAGYPVPLWSSDPALHDRLAHQIGDTMTAVRVRGRGRGPTSILVRTAKHFFASRCAGSVAFNYGFNTAHIRKISTSFNESEQVEPVPFREASTNDLRLPGSVSLALSSFARSLSVSTVDAVDDEWDAFFEAVAPAYGLLVRRDARYLKWRYLDHPVLRYQLVALRSKGKLVGWSAFHRRGDLFVWGDALFAPSHVAGAANVLSHALRSSTGAGATRVRAWFPRRPGWWSAAVDALGLAIGREPDDLALMCTPFLRSDAPTILGRELYYTACDSDLY